MLSERAFMTCTHTDDANATVFVQVYVRVTVCMQVCLTITV